MLEPPTIPMPVITVSRATMRAQRRKAVDDRQRAEDLRQASMPGALSRTEALAIAARMSARGEDKTTREEKALRELMRRHGLTGPMISHEQRGAKR